MRDFYIFDITRNRHAIDRINTCEVAAKLRLYNGSRFSEEDIRKLWKLRTNSPSFDKINKNIRVPNIKWYIHSHTDELIYDPEWNPDFLMGMLEWGRIFPTKHFPSFQWFSNYDLLLALHSSPFAGTLTIKVPQKRNRYRWSCVPALCFKYSSDTVNYLAGVLSTGEILTYKDKKLARYNRKVGKIIKNLGIPIEHQTKRFVFISPFWGVVIHKHMPKVLQDKWAYVPHAYKAQEYSAILWKIFTGKDPAVAHMPYLMSRRTIFYKYGSMKALREMWISNHLVELDSRFKKVVQKWQENGIIEPKEKL